MFDQCRKEKYCLFDSITAQLICRAFNFGKVLLTLCLYHDEGLCSDEGTYDIWWINASSLVLFAKFDQVDLVVFELVVYSAIWNVGSVGVAPVSRGHGFKPRWSPDFFRLLFVIAWIAFKTAMIMAYLISNPQLNIWNISYITSHPFFTGSLELTNDQLPTSVAS